jgi:hypothetical protein
MESTSSFEGMQNELPIFQKSPSNFIKINMQSSPHTDNFMETPLKLCRNKILFWPPLRQFYENPSSFEGIPRGFPIIKKPTNLTKNK